MATKKTTKRAPAKRKTSAPVRKKPASAQKVRFFGLELSYFIIPLIVVAVGWLDKWFMFAGWDWAQTLHKSAISHHWAHYILWYAAYVYTTIGLVFFWNAHQRNQQFVEVVSALCVNLFCFLVGHYLFFINHSIGASLLFFIGALISLGYVIYRLWPKHRVVAWLLVPYGVAMVYAVYVMHTVWMIN